MKSTSAVAFGRFNNRILSILIILQLLATVTPFTLSNNPQIESNQSNGYKLNVTNAIENSSSDHRRLPRAAIARKERIWDYG